MSRKILIADLLCGAGGSSTGAIKALVGLGFAPADIVLTCVNHWPVAIDTHSRNHPQARHHVQDIATVRPHLLVPEGYLDLLMASPPLTKAANAASLPLFVVPEKRGELRNRPRRFAASRKARTPLQVQGPHAHVQGASLKAWGARPWPCFSALGAALPEKRSALDIRATETVMAAKPRRAVARTLVDDFHNPHAFAKRSTKKRGRPQRLTAQVAAEALDLLEALAQCFHPVSAGPAGALFLCALDPPLLDRLAALGAEACDDEPSLGSGEGCGHADQSRWWGDHTAASDGEQDAGEEPEIDAGDEPEFDPAEHGIADADALAAFYDEAAAIEAFADAARTSDLHRLRHVLAPLADRREARLAAARLKMEC